MLDNEFIKISFERFAKAVVKQARANLTRNKHNVSGELYKSLDNWTVEVSKGGSISLKFSMAEHGEFQDRGVKGADPTKSHKMKESTPYKYTSKKPPIKDLEKWVKAKRFQFRDSKGKFKSYRDTAFIVQNSVYNKGIPQTLFFTRPFKSKFKDLPGSLISAFGDDVERFLSSQFSDKKRFR